MTSKQPHILIFDSGFGGLTITKEILHRIPNTKITYIADSDYFPYGTKPTKPLLQRINKVFKASYESVQPDIAIIACNTASTIALNTLRDEFPINIIGVVPAIKPAALLSKSKVIGVLGTTGTVERDYTKNLIHNFAKDCKVYLHGSSKLAEIAEQKLLGYDISLDEIKTELELLLSQNKCIDTVVLACTHFPLLLEELNEVCSKKMQWVDSGKAIAKRTQHLLELNFDTDNQLANQECQLTIQSTKTINEHKPNTAAIRKILTPRNAEIYYKHIAIH